MGEELSYRDSAIYEEWPATDLQPRRWKCRHCREWDGVHHQACPYVGRCGYERFEPDNTDSPITKEQALEGINRIRNSIVGLQTINWSEHIYPLVSLLERAGYEGERYGDARADACIVLDRLDAMREGLRFMLDNWTSPLCAEEIDRLRALVDA